MAFRGTVALVTGAASGMGRISAERLAAGGARVAAVDVNEEGLETLAAVRAGIRPYRCDVSDPAAVRELLQRVSSELGPPDRVTHAAAIMPTSLLADAEPEWVARLMRINYEGTVNVALPALRMMRERGSGDLILFGSVAGFVPAPHLGAYGATKAAVNLFAETLIHENRDCGVRILLVCPPMTDTPLIRQALETSNPRSIRVGIEQKRLADPHMVVDEIERAIDKGSGILLPGREARFLYLMRRLAPGLLWRLVEKAERS